MNSHLSRLALATLACAAVLFPTGCRRRHYPPDIVTVTGRAAIAGPVEPAYEPPPPPPPAPSYNLGIVSAWGEGAPSPNHQGAQARLMAKRAAESVARRNLLEEVKGVQLSSNTYVRDFVTESDEISTRVDGLVRGARVVEEETMPDGAVRVRVEADLSGLNQTFSQHHARLAPPPPQRAIAVQPTGGNPAQARLMALRGAEADARRQLLEYAKGMQLESGTYVRDFITEHDHIRTRIEGYIRGARKTGERVTPDGVAEVDMSLDMSKVRQLVR